MAYAFQLKVDWLEKVSNVCSVTPVYVCVMARVSGVKYDHVDESLACFSTLVVEFCWACVDVGLVCRGV